MVQSCHNADDKAEGQRGGDNTRAWALPLSADRVLSVEPHHLPDSNCPPSCGVLFQEDGGVETQELKWPVPSASGILSEPFYA